MVRIGSATVNVFTESNNKAVKPYDPNVDAFEAAAADYATAVDSYSPIRALLLKLHGNKTMLQHVQKTRAIRANVANSKTNKTKKGKL